MQYLLTNHLRSVSAITDASGELLGEQRYLPFGGSAAGLDELTETDFSYTGQRDLAALVWVALQSAFLLRGAGVLTQPDTIVPERGFDKDANRYTYVTNNPI